mmetsp:Transcript_11585/g.48681  ORF Transcript_11585/g.48681 Transcript_11585/m.48681 type:complete len:328 (+) Transcript_11585:1622-2605(+)
MRARRPPSPRSTEPPGPPSPSSEDISMRLLDPPRRELGELFGLGWQSSAQAATKKTRPETFPSLRFRCTRRSVESGLHHCSRPCTHTTRGSSLALHSIKEKSASSTTSSPRSSSSRSSSGHKSTVSQKYPRPRGQAPPRSMPPATRASKRTPTRLGLSSKVTTTSPRCPSLGPLLADAGMSANHALVFPIDGAATSPEGPRLLPPPLYCTRSPLENPSLLPPRSRSPPLGRFRLERLTRPRSMGSGSSPPRSLSLLLRRLLEASPKDSRSMAWACDIAPPRLLTYIRSLRPSGGSRLVLSAAPRLTAGAGTISRAVSQLNVRMFAFS